MNTINEIKTLTVQNWDDEERQSLYTAVVTATPYTVSQVWAVGSRVMGHHVNDSDLDLMIILQNENLANDLNMQAKSYLQFVYRTIDVSASIRVKPRFIWKDGKDLSGYNIITKEFHAGKPEDIALREIEASEKRKPDYKFFKKYVTDEGRDGIYRRKGENFLTKALSRCDLRVSQTDMTDIQRSAFMGVFKDVLFSLSIGDIINANLLAQAINEATAFPSNAAQRQEAKRLKDNISEYLNPPQQSSARSVKI